MSSDLGSSRRGSNACSQSSLSSNGSSLTATRDLWRLRQTMHCLEKCPFYHGSLNRNKAREKMRRCRPVSLIEHYSSKYQEMNVIALRYPVSKEGEINMEGIGDAHACYVEQPGEDNSGTPRIIHPETAASLAGSSAPSCVSCTSHSGPSKLDSDRVMEPVERVNRSNSDGSIAHRGAFNHCTIGSLTHRKSLDQGLIMTHNDHVTPQELKTSIQEKLHERIQNQDAALPTIFSGLEPLISTERRSSVDMKPQAIPVNHFGSGSRTPVDQYGRSDCILTTGQNLNNHVAAAVNQSCASTSGQKLGEPAKPEIKNPLPISLPVTSLCSAVEINQDRDYNLNSFGNIQIDLTNLGAILGSTSITVGKPVNEPVDESSNQNATDLSDYK